MKKQLLFLIVFVQLFLVQLVAQTDQPDLIITNGRIVDGTGNSWFKADLAIKGNRIVEVKKGLKEKFPRVKVIDAANKIVSP